MRSRRRARRMAHRALGFDWRTRLHLRLVSWRLRANWWLDDHVNPRS